MRWALGCFIIALSFLTVGVAWRAAAEDAVTPARASLAENKARTALDVMALGRDLFRKGQYRRAAIEFEKALQIDPPNLAAAGYLKLCEKKLEGR